MTDLYPTEVFWFNNRREQAKRAFDYGKVQNDYERKLAKDQAGWDRSDLLRQFTQQRERLPGAFNRRGIMNSGLYQRGWKDWSDNKVRSLSRQSYASGERQRGFDIAEFTLADIRQKALNDLADQQRAYEEQARTVIRTN